jgi:hypothetical protein
MAPKIIEAPDGKMIEFPEDMADSMINLVMAKQYPIPAIAAQPSFMERMTPSPQTISNFVRPGLEYGGMLAGGVMAAPAGPAGVIAGAGLGYAGGRQAANLADQFLLDKKTPDALTQISNAGKDFVSGTTMEMGGGILANLLKRGGSAIANSGLPERIYARGIKTPLSDAWKRTIPGTDWTYRENAVKTGLADEIVASQYGKQNLLHKKENIENFRTGVIGDLEKESLATGSFRTPSSDVRSVLDNLKYEAQFSTHPEEAVGALNHLDGIIQKAAGVKSYFTPKELHTLKKNFQADVNYERVKPLLNTSGRLSEEGVGKVATEAMTTLETINPSLKYLNKKDQSYILLQKSIENTLARYENSPTIPLSSKILLLKHFGLAALDVLTGTPAMKTSLAIALKKAGTMQAKSIGKAAILYGLREEDTANRF